MRELSLHILDLAQNSIKANATLIEIEVNVNIPEDIISFSIKDNGIGMSEDFLSHVTDPFVTTRTVRKVGMGISLTKAGCEACDGSFIIESKLNQGTCLKASYKYNHIDRQPLGAIEETMSNLILMNPAIDFIYRHQFNGVLFEFDTREIKKTLDGAPINDLDVINFIKEYIAENIKNISGGLSV